MSRKPIPAAFSVALALTLILPLLNYFRDPPLGDFYGEWSSAICFSLTAILALRILPRRIVFPPSLWAGPVVLCLILVLHVAVGRFDYDADWLLWPAYFVLLLLAMLLGAAARESEFRKEFIDRLCWTLILVGGVNAIFQIIQLARLDEALWPFVVPLVNRSICRVYGNAAQANHAAALAALALAATVYLLHVRRVGTWQFLVLAAIFLFSLSVTASRMGWLMLAVILSSMVLLGGWVAPSWRDRLRLAAAIVGGLLLFDFIAAVWLLPGLSPNCSSAIGRVAGESGSLSIRTELWRQALMVWSSQPMLGVGAGNFMGTVYELQPLGRHQPLDYYVHSIPLQILAEFGAVGASVVAIAVLAWIVGVFNRRRALDAEDNVLISWLGVVGVHALLEFPLWYVHFLVFFGLCIGLLVRPRSTQGARQLPLRQVIVATSIAILIGSTVIFVDYRRLDRPVFISSVLIANPHAVNPESLQVLQAAVDDVRIYRVQAQYAAQFLTRLDGTDYPAKIAATDRLLRRVPVADTIKRRIVLSAASGDLDSARQHLQRLFMFYPHQSEEVVKDIRELIDLSPKELSALGLILDEEWRRAPSARW